MMSIVMTGIITTMLLAFMFQYLKVGYATDASLETLVSRLNAADYIRESIGTSTGLISQNGLPDARTLVPDPAQPSNTYWLPIHAIPDTRTAAAGSYTPIVYYRRFSVTSTKALIMNGTTPYEDEYVIYLNGTTGQLLVRTIANNSAPSNAAKSSCPPASTTASCPADKILARNVTSVASRFFSRSGNLIDYRSSTDITTGQYNGPDYTSVEAIEFSINFSVKPLFEKTKTVQSTSVVRIALRNS